MSKQPVAQSPDLNQKPDSLRTIVLRLWPLTIGLVLVLFPFDWLGNVWPAYRQVFEQVFVGAREHHIGHSIMFFIVGLILLLSFSVLLIRLVLFISCW
jgi:hypothetical protein